VHLELWKNGDGRGRAVDPRLLAPTVAAMAKQTDSHSRNLPVPVHAKLPVPVAAKNPRASKKPRATGRARTVLDKPAQQGWRTTDEDEIALRRWRGRTEIVAIEPLEPEQPLFGTFRAQSGSGGFYEVEIRSLEGFVNSCGCIDHRVNGLGTCKHIEGALAALEGAPRQSIA